MKLLHSYEAKLPHIGCQQNLDRIRHDVLHNLSIVLSNFLKVMRHYGFFFRMRIIAQSIVSRLLCSESNYAISHLRIIPEALIICFFNVEYNVVLWLKKLIGYCTLIYIFSSTVQWPWTSVFWRAGTSSGKTKGWLYDTGIVGGCSQSVATCQTRYLRLV